MLAAQSGYFANFFASNFPGAKSDRMDIQDVDPIIFERALDYMYVGLARVCADELERLMSVAALLHINKMTESITKKLLDIMDVDNCISIMSCADRFQNDKLLRRGEIFVREAFEHFGANPGLPEVSMRVLLQSSRLNVLAETEVFLTLTRWLNNLVDPLEEEARIGLYALVRFPLLTQDFLDSDAVLMQPKFSISWLTDHHELFFGGDEATQSRMRRPRDRMRTSNILSVADNHQILDWLGLDNGASLEKLYTGSTDGMNALSFHDKYAPLPPFIVLLCVSILMRLVCMCACLGVRVCAEFRASACTDSAPDQLRRQRPDSQRHSMQERLHIRGVFDCVVALRRRVPGIS